MKRENAFTLVEITVVMALIALLTLLVATGMLGAGKQVKLRDATKTLQSNIRQMANNSISVAPDLNDSSKSAKAWVIKIPGNTTNSYYIEDYYDVSGSKSEKEVKLDYGVTINSNNGNDLYLVFSSPFAEFNVREGSISGAWTEDPEMHVITPPGSLYNGDISITLTYPGGKTMTVSVDKGTGEASVK